jgi:hypothetical protein
MKAYRPLDGSLPRHPYRVYEHENTLLGMATDMFDFSPCEDECFAGRLRALHFYEKSLATPFALVVVGLEFVSIFEVLVALRLQADHPPDRWPTSPHKGRHGCALGLDAITLTTLDQTSLSVEQQGLLCVYVSIISPSGHYRLCPHREHAFHLPTCPDGHPRTLTLSPRPARGRGF